MSLFFTLDISLGIALSNVCMCSWCLFLFLSLFCLFCVYPSRIPVQIYLSILPVAYRMTFTAKFQLISSKWQCVWNENIKSVWGWMGVFACAVCIHTEIQNGNLLRIIGIEYVCESWMDLIAIPLIFSRRQDIHIENTSVFSGFGYR